MVRVSHLGPRRVFTLLPLPGRCLFAVWRDRLKLLDLLLHRICTGLDGNSRLLDGIAAIAPVASLVDWFSDWLRGHAGCVLHGGGLHLVGISKSLLRSSPESDWNFLILRSASSTLAE